MAGRGYAAPTNFGEAPKGYVPGIGRGAAGFMTRSDLGGAVAPAPGQVRNPPQPLNPRGGTPRRTLDPRPQIPDRVA